MTKNKKTNSERPVKIGGAARDIIEKLKKNGGWGKYDQQAGFKGGKVFLPGILLSIRLQDLKELTRPENSTPYMVEFVHVGKEAFLHLVDKPPQYVLDAIVQKGAGHYTASNDIGPFLDTLDKTFPSKPVAKNPPAKKAKPDPEQVPAKTPKQLTEEALSKIIKTAKVGSPEYNNAQMKLLSMEVFDYIKMKLKIGRKF